MAKRESYTIKEVVEDNFDEMRGHLKEIKEQTTKTNGRVQSLELSRAWIWGAMAVLTLLGGAIITLSILAIDNRIKDAVKQTLSEYEIK